jgi:hypothetical protein
LIILTGVRKFLNILSSGFLVEIHALKKNCKNIKTKNKITEKVKQKIKSKEQAT